MPNDKTKPANCRKIAKKNYELHVLYLGFRKAFDSVYQKLVDKLSQQGLGGKLSSMMSSYQNNLQSEHKKIQVPVKM